MPSWCWNTWRNPRRFWDKLYEVLKDNGVFWGLTVDGRHWFRRASLWAERLKIKDRYLNYRFGARGSTAMKTTRCITAPTRPRRSSRT